MNNLNEVHDDISSKIYCETDTLRMDKHNYDEDFSQNWFIRV